MESDLHHDNFLKEYEQLLGYKSHFELRSKIQTSMRLQRTSLFPIFVLANEVTKVIKEMKDTRDICKAEVIGKNYVYGGEAIPAMLRPLQFPQCSI